MIVYEPTQDIDLIRKCVTNPIVWRAGTDDGMIDINPELFFVNPHGKLWLKSGDYGLFMFEPRNYITYEVHTMLFPEARGKSIDIAIGAIEWIFNNTRCLRITTSVPGYNVLAKRLSIKSGMKLIGNNEKSFLKDGILYDQYLYGISKGDICHLQQ